MPLFITFEGPDGSGKSTQADLLARSLRERGYAVTETREPGGTELGETVRNILLAPDGSPASALSMTFLLSAARAEHVETVIRPSLASGQTLICDRYADSTVAYQGYGFGLDLDTVRTLNRIATGGLQPDVTLYIDIEPEVGLERCRARGLENRLDRETLKFHRRVREGYLALIAEDPSRWICVNGDAPPDQVHDAILPHLIPLLGTGAIATDGRAR